MSFTFFSLIIVIVFLIILEIFGVEISGKKNLAKGEEVEISTPESKVKVFVIPTNEELMIARETARLI